MLVVMLPPCLFVAEAGGLLEGGMVRCPKDPSAGGTVYFVLRAFRPYEVIRLGALALIDHDEDAWFRKTSDEEALQLKE